MRRALPFIGLALFFAAAAALAGGIQIASTTAYHYQLSGCDGGTSLTLPGSTDGTKFRYVMTVSGELTYLCIPDAGCASGGQPFASGLTAEFDISSTVPVSCRSATTIGQVDFSLLVPGS